MRFYRGDPETSSLPRRRMRGFLLAMTALLSAYLLIAGDCGLYQVWHRDRQIAALRGEIEGIKENNTRLQQEVSLLEDDLETIERIARERYGMVKAEESVYMVYPHSPEAGKKAVP